MVAAGTGIHVKERDGGISHYLQNVGVTADEQARPQPSEFFPGLRVVIAGITADVRHVDVDALAFPK